MRIRNLFATTVLASAAALMGACAEPVESYPLYTAPWSTQVQIAAVDDEGEPTIEKKPAATGGVYVAPLYAEFYTAQRPAPQGTAVVTVMWTKSGLMLMNTHGNQPGTDDDIPYDPQEEHIIEPGTPSVKLP